MNRSERNAAALFAGAIAAFGCSEEPPPPEMPPRAVVAIEQALRSPAQRLRLAGTAAAWKQETLSFEVSGRVAWVIEPEQSVSGPSVDESFRPGKDGTVIARIDPERYENALRAAQASLASIQAQLRATRQQLEDVLPQDLAQAESERKRAEDNFQRMQRAVERNAVAGTELTNAQAAFDTSRAAVDSVRGRLKAKQSELEGLQAQVAQAEQSVQNAEIDLRDTELRAPFSGRVTQVSVVPGALVQPGTPVVELVMMDPIKIELTVSARTDRKIGDQDQALVFPREADEPIVASVYQRDSVADSATRTVRLTLICRNPEITDAPVDATLIEDVIPLIQFPAGEREAWFLERRCVQRDAAGTYAWRLSDPGRQITGRAFEVERMPVVLGEARKDFVGLYQFHEMIPPAELEPLLAQAPGITVHKLLFALGVPDGFEGGKVAVVRRAWQIRPGDVLDVELNLEAPERGVYVPASAILHEGEQPFVLLVRDDGDAAVLQRADVELSGAVGSDVRIGEAVIGEGEPIVRSGTHVLRAGERVQLTEVMSAR